MMSETVPPKEASQQLYAIIRDDLPFEEKARRALELGRNYLGADYGYLTRIDTETNDWETVVSTEPADGAVPEGMQADLGTTYCRRTIAAGDQIVLHDAPNQSWDDDIAFETYGLHCYVGTTILLDGEPYGTVCFSAEDPRDEPYSEGETMFAELISRLLERELEREQHEAQLTRQRNLSQVLNRVLRHNLRNDLAVIRGRTQLVADGSDAKRSAGIALNRIDDLIDLSEKARQLDEVVAEELDPEPTPLVPLIERISEQVRRDHPAASIAITATEDVTVAVRPSLERALTELIENAAKHGGPDPSVTISIEAVPNAVEIGIADDGPGMEDQELQVLESGTETPLLHGSGLGLWLAQWIVSSHDGTIEATVSDAGTRLAVRVPRRLDGDSEGRHSQLTRARDEYRAAFEEANDGMVIVNNDAEILDANPAASAIYGLDRAALLGQPLSRFLTEGFEFEREWEAFKAAGEDRDTVTIIGGDGQERLVEYSATTDIVPGEHLVVSRDITAEAEQRRELERKTRAMDAAPLGIAISDPSREDNPIIWVNEAFERLTGYSQEDMVGRNCRLLQGPETDPEPVAALREAIAEDFPVTVELTNYRKDGATFRNRVTVAPVRDEQGQVTNYVGFQEEIADGA